MKYFPFFIAIIFFSACEEVIQVELNESEQRIVIEGNIEADNQKAVVEISKSGSFYATSDFEKITGANVLISNENGEAFQLTETSDGNYEIDNFDAEIGDNFSVDVTDPDGNVYKASTLVPRIIEIDDLSFEKKEGAGSVYYIVSCFLQDPKNEKNYYRIKYSLNGELNNDDYVVFDDLTFDGEYIEVPLYIDEIVPGDVFGVELISFDKDSYEYFTQIADVAFAGYSNSVPYNPQGNLSNNALGYFGARGSDWDSIVLE